MSLPIALSLFSVRDDLLRDFDATLEQVALIGYEYVELAGLGEKTASQVKALLDRLNLVVVSTHVPFDHLQGNLAPAIDTAAALGYNIICCPYLPESLRTAEGYRQVRAALLKTAQRLAEHDIKLAYHNHSFEFETLDDGSRGIDILHGDPDPLWHAELDVYWVCHGGDDPLAWMKKLAGRLPVLHLKDMTPGPDPTFTELGAGVVEISALVKAAPDCGVQYLVVEQDANWVDGSAMRSVAVSLDYLKSLA